MNIGTDRVMKMIMGVSRRWCYTVTCIHNTLIVICTKHLQEGEGLFLDGVIITATVVKDSNSWLSSWNFVVIHILMMVMVSITTTVVSETAIITGSVIIIIIICGTIVIIVTTESDRI